MSKSLGNSPDPLDIIDNWGTDAFRFTLSMLSPPGKDVFFEEEKLELGRNFTNKLWQASRLVMSAAEKETQPIISNDAKAPVTAFAAMWHDAFGTHSRSNRHCRGRIAGSSPRSSARRRTRSARSPSGV
jgi:valyl-tRNA synthetase